MLPPYFNDEIKRRICVFCTNCWYLRYKEREEGFFREKK